MFDKFLRRAPEKPSMYSALRQGSDSTEERLPLSGNEDYHDDIQSKESTSENGYYNEKPTASRSRWKAVCFHLALISIYSIAFIGAIYTTATSKITGRQQHSVYSPLHEAIEMEPKMVHASFANKNPFKGPPSDELDHAWHQLFINSNVRVTADDLAQINKTSVPVTDDKGGFYAIPDVYHQLHCLKFLRQVIYKDYYNIEKPTTPIHIDHCIDNLRQNLMCKGDVSLVTFSWVDNDRAPKPNFEVEHECVNWEKMDNWAKDHRFDIFDEKTLVHPSLGPSFPEAEYKATGRVPGHPDFRPNHFDHDSDHINHNDHS
ncbi:uncharacterized protein TRUGW13939_11823 [Talaromyces rugulosus]|uniref:Tat pathway signal sequence n=1 Tax=Talaromyces rugulosus TaxID=121627 RepID=A0A7H8REV6_TALRU|nr:uncharacterized protein TRUGW13939_11823 [Talaromyces rugulosus]QKX64647.1 hypothetical protein TRUGW13939_11823 [Talaromyces rugulosus]